MEHYNQKKLIDHSNHLQRMLHFCHLLVTRLFVRGTGTLLSVKPGERQLCTGAAARRWGLGANCGGRAARLRVRSSGGAKAKSTFWCSPCRKTCKAPRTAEDWKGVPKLEFERVLIESADFAELAQHLLEVQCRRGGSQSFGCAARPRGLVYNGFLDHTM